MTTHHESSFPVGRLARPAALLVLFALTSGDHTGPGAGSQYEGYCINGAVVSLKKSAMLYAGPEQNAQQLQAPEPDVGFVTLGILGSVTAPDNNQRLFGIVYGGLHRDVVFIDGDPSVEAQCKWFRTESEFGSKPIKGYFSLTERGLRIRKNDLVVFFGDGNPQNITPENIMTARVVGTDGDQINIQWIIDGKIMEGSIHKNFVYGGERE